MRAVVVGLCLLGCFAATAGAGEPTGTATVYASSTKPGTKNVALTFKLRYLMQCGSPGQTMTVRLPPAMSVPTTIPAGVVLVNGKPSSAVSVSGKTVSIALAKKQWVTCDVLGLGDLLVVIGKRAGLGNPKAAGIYTFPLTIDRVAAAPRLRIV